MSTNMDEWDGSWGRINYKKDFSDIIKQKITYFYHVGVDFNMKDKSGWTPLFYAITHCTGDIVELLISGGADATIKGPKEEFSLHFAVSEGNLSAVKTLCKLTPSIINEKDEQGQTALHYAAKKGFDKAVTFLIKMGVDINAQDKFGQTALHYAAKSCLSTTKALIDAGAGAFIKDNDGYTAFNYAKNKDIQEIILNTKENRINSSKTIVEKVFLSKLLGRQNG